MTTLLLRCRAPLQSWGLQSRFTERDTAREPTKSGILGLVAAALGLSRSDPIDHLAALRFGARVDKPGVVIRDFHTALEVAKASGASPDTVISNRYYLADAAFLVGLEGDESLLDQIDTSLADPVWPLYLGRKACPPTPPLRLTDGMRRGASLEQALEHYPVLDGLEVPEVGLRCAIECLAGEEGVPQRDTPVTFDSKKRSFTSRLVKTVYVTPPVTPGDEEVPHVSE